MRSSLKTLHFLCASPHTCLVSYSIGAGESVTHPNLYFDKSREFDRAAAMELDA